MDTNNLPPQTSGHLTEKAKEFIAKAQEACNVQNTALAKDILIQCVEECPDFLGGYLGLVDVLLGNPLDPVSGDYESAVKVIANIRAKFGDHPMISERIQKLQIQIQKAKALNESHDRIAALRNKHKGQRCVIVGNGPSLNKMDLSFLKNEFVIGLNRIYLGFDRFEFEPDYLVCVNKFVIEQSAEDLMHLKIPKFISMEGVPYIEASDDLMVINPMHYKDMFSKDPLEGLCIGSTVTYCAMQLAYYLGFETVVLIGVDHYFETKGEAHKLVQSTGDDPNHFDPNYFGKGYKWQLPDLVGSERMYRLADAFFKADRNRVIDATWEGHCDIFDKVDYRNYFKFPDGCTH